MTVGELKRLLDLKSDADPVCFVETDDAHQFRKVTRVLDVCSLDVHDVKGIEDAPEGLFVALLDEEL